MAKNWTIKGIPIFVLNIKESNMDSFNSLEADTRSFLVGALTKEGRLLTNFVKSSFLSGPPGVSRRTGQLYKSAKVIPGHDDGAEIVSGVSMGEGVPYAALHIGPAGKVTVVRPKSGSRLAVPLYSVLTATGKLPVRLKGSLRNNPNLFRPRGTGKNAQFIFEKLSKGKIVPRFVLKKSISVRTRVHPEQIVAMKTMEIQERVERRISDYLKAQTK